MECEVPEIVPDAQRAFQRLRVLLLGLVLCRGLVWVCVLPLFECWDEYEHVAYVVHVAETGLRPIPGHANVPRSLLPVLVNYPLPRCVVDLQLGRLGARDYRAFWLHPDRVEPRPGTMELYEAQHGWWYYRLAAPWFQWLGGVDRPLWSVAGLRLLNLLFVAAAFWVALGVLNRLARSPRDAIWMGLAIAAQPLFLINGVRVANDALGILLATLAIGGSLSLKRSGWAWRCAFIGLAAGLATLAKAVNFALVPFIAVAWCGFVFRARLSPARAVLGGLVLAAGFLIVTQDEIRTNLSRYGTPTPMQEALVNKRQGRTTRDVIRAASVFRWDKQIRRLWLRETFFAGGWSNQGPSSGWISVYSGAVSLGLIGFIFTIPWFGGRTDPVFRSRQTPILCGVLCLSLTAALGYHTVQSFLAWGKPTTCPWYACAGIPWFLALVVAGGRTWPIGLARTGISLVFPGIGLSTECFVQWTRMRSTYSGGTSGWLSLQRLAALQPPMFGTTTLMMAEAGVIVCLAGVLLLLQKTSKSTASPGQAGSDPRPEAAHDRRRHPLRMSYTSAGRTNGRSTVSRSE